MPNNRFAKPLPSFFMGKTAASNRIAGFLSSKHVVLSNELGTTDTKSIWYSFSHIENLFKELVYLNADGLRIYLGAYEDDHQDFPGQLCLVMVPTRFDPDTEGHEDVLLEDDVDFPERPGSELYQSATEAEQLSKAFNYGAPCPTICPFSVKAIKYPLNLVSM